MTRDHSMRRECPPGGAPGACKGDLKGLKFITKSVVPGNYNLYWTSSRISIWSGEGNLSGFFFTNIGKPAKVEI